VGTKYPFFEGRRRLQKVSARFSIHNISVNMCLQRLRQRSRRSLGSNLDRVWGFYDCIHYNAVLCYLIRVVILCVWVK
jgi:hypothetical protein